MRKKLFIGLLLAAIAGIVAGEYLFNRSGAQDAPKKAEPEQKKGDGNLFDILTKDLEAKKAKDAGLAFPLPPPLPTPPGAAPKDLTLPSAPPLSPLKEEKPLPAPQKASDPVLPPLPPNVPATQAPAPPIVSQPPLPPTVSDKTPTVEPKPGEPLPHQPPPNPTPRVGSDDLPPLSKPKTDGPTPPTPSDTAPTFPAPIETPRKDPNVKPAIDNDFPSPGSYPKQAFDKGQDVATITDQVAKLKNCPWSLQIEMADSQTIVTATVNKKHEFKIVCQSLDLQTAKGMLKASGKVQISGDALNGTCEHLAIPLMEDRLVLEGGAALTIQKVATSVSDAKPAAFELKGETLNLRISELASAKLIQASWMPPPPRDPLVVNDKTQANLNGAGKWSSYGTLERHESKMGPFWRLIPTTGNSIDFVTHEGKSMDQFVGQTISVFGRREQIDGRPMLRVTHVALP